MQRSVTQSPSVGVGHGANPPVFDAAVLGAFLCQDSGAIAAVLQTFLASMVENMDGLHAALERQDVAAVVVLAHRIKGGALMSGATTIAQVSRRLERDAEAADLHAVEQAGREIEQQWQLFQKDRALLAALSARPG